MRDGSNMIRNYERDNFWVLNWLDKFMVGHNGFICGGCFKNIFNKEKVKDIDIFFENQNDWDNAVEYYDNLTAGYWKEDGSEVSEDEAEYVFYYKNDNVKAYKHIKTGVVIELCCKIFGTAEELAVAYEHRIPVVALNENKNEIHPWLVECCTRICESREELVDHICEFYLT